MANCLRWCRWEVVCSAVPFLTSLAVKLANTAARKSVCECESETHVQEDSRERSKSGLLCLKTSHPAGDR